MFIGFSLPICSIFSRSRCSRVKLKYLASRSVYSTAQTTLIKMLSKELNEELHTFKRRKLFESEAGCAFFSARCTQLQHSQISFKGHKIKRQKKTQISFISFRVFTHLFALSFHRILSSFLFCNVHCFCTQRENLSLS